MRADYRGRGVIVYEKEHGDLVSEAVLRLAQRNAEGLSDHEAAQVGVLFKTWQAGMPYGAGERISDGVGRLYRVVQAHTAQADWPMDATPALYTPLGVTVEEPEAVPQWRQPTGAQDAYQKGDRVRHNGVLYESTLDANVWQPGVSGWTEVTQ